MKDYKITISVKNNYLLETMQSMGIKNAAELARATGVSPSEVGAYINLKKSPYGPKGMRNSIMKIANFLGTLPEDLFPPQHIRNVLKRNITTIKLEMSQILSLVSHQQSPQQKLELTESRDTVTKALEILTDKEHDVITGYFGIDREKLTLVELAETYEVTSPYIGSIRDRAIIKLRNKKLPILESTKNDIYGN